MAMPSAVIAGVLSGLMVLSAPPAAAGPDCGDLTPHTRICQRPGHVGITTSPDPALTNRPPGWGYGGIGSIFGSGFGVGFGPVAGVWTGF